MGILNLLPLLDKSTRSCHISEFRGHTVAVDSYCWLHKGSRSCALQLAKGESTDLFVRYCLKYVNLLLSYGIKPIMVFDGRHLPAKLKTEERRRADRKSAKKQGIELLRLGKVEEACKQFKKCVDVTPEMALQLMQACRKINVDCIVAPYESDAQLAFFNTRNLAELVITEDSDLLLFGCKKVLYKMDLDGSGQLVEAEKLHISMNIRLENYTFDKFRHMCILSGCDYLDSLPGIGLKKALKFIKLTAEDNPKIFLDRLPRYLNMRHLSVSSEYKENFLIADATFRHQIVFDPIKRQLVPLNPVEPSNSQYCVNAGVLFNEEEAYQLALGNLNPLTMKQIDNWSPNSQETLSVYSIWCHNFVAKPLKKDAMKISIFMKRMPLDPKTVEDNNLNYDLELGRVLEFYKSESSLIVEKESPTKVTEETSPIMKTFTNPFAKKKLSKFPITEIKEKVVTSRFFSTSQNATNEVANAETTLKTENVATSNDGVITKVDLKCEELRCSMTKSDSFTEDENLESPSIEDVETSPILKSYSNMFVKTKVPMIDIPMKDNIPNVGDGACINNDNKASSCEYIINDVEWQYNFNVSYLSTTEIEEIEVLPDIIPFDEPPSPESGIFPLDSPTFEPTKPQPKKEVKRGTKRMLKTNNTQPGKKQATIKEMFQRLHQK